MSSPPGQVFNPTADQISLAIRAFGGGGEERKEQEAGKMTTGEPWQSTPDQSIYHCSGGPLIEKERRESPKARWMIEQAGRPGQASS